MTIIIRYVFIPWTEFLIALPVLNMPYYFSHNSVMHILIKYLVKQIEIFENTVPELNFNFVYNFTGF